jgi:hypothetical protein
VYQSILVLSFLPSARSFQALSVRCSKLLPNEVLSRGKAFLQYFIQLQSPPTFALALADDIQYTNKLINKQVGLLKLGTSKENRISPLSNSGEVMVFLSATADFEVLQVPS